MTPTKSAVAVIGVCSLWTTWAPSGLCDVLAERARVVNPALGGSGWMTIGTLVFVLPTVAVVVALVIVLRQVRRRARLERALLASVAGLATGLQVSFWYQVSQLARGGC